jgi:hypothetical protein
MSSLWEQRAARNEALFREVNENIHQLEQRYGEARDLPQFVCECANGDCVERLRIPAGSYRAVREHPRRFVLVPGHERPDLERVVERHAAYLVVEKVGAAGDFAERAQG